MKVLGGILIAAAGLLALGYAFMTRKKPDPPREQPEKPPPAGAVAVVVSKSRRSLTLYVEGRAAFTCPVAIGGSSAGHKSREGDRRTPEGEYYICTRNEKSRFHLFLGLSYPDARDAALGLSDGVISREEHDAVVRAIAERRQPPWKTALGGEVGLHGKGEGRSTTLGCIAMSDEAIEVLWKHCPLGTPVRIDP